MKDRVCIVFRNDKDSSVRTLVYRPSGEVRTYEPGKIDSRAGNPIIITDKDQIKYWLSTHFGSENSIAIPVPMAMALFGWKKEEFAEN